MNIWQLNIFLLCLISVMAIFHRGAGRSSAFIYASCMVSQALISGKLEGYEYFISCAMFETIIIVLLCSFSAPSRLTDILISITCLSWIVSATGASLWHFGYNLDPYYYSCTALYIVAATTMLWEDGTHDNGRCFVSRVFRVISYPGLILRRSIHGKAT
jgi:hypothetical protein